MRSTSEKVAAYLLEWNPILKGGGYTLCCGVMTHNISRNGFPIPSKESDASLDLVVCKGDRVVLGIACSKNSQHLFTALLPGVPFLLVCDEENPLPLEVENCNLGYGPSQDCLENLCGQVTRRLSGGSPHRESLMAYRKRAMGLRAERREVRYTLTTVSLNEAIEAMGRNAADLQENLKARRLMDETGSITQYGAVSGLFLCCSAIEDGTVLWEPMTSPSSIQRLNEAIIAYAAPKKGCSKRALSERLARMEKNLPSDDAYAVSALSRLLNAPLETLYQNHPDARQKLYDTLDCAQEQLGEMAITVEGRGVVTYMDCVRIIHAVRQCLPDDPWDDSYRDVELRKICEKLLLHLSGVFLVSKDFLAANYDPTAKRSLSSRIRDLPLDTYKKYSVFQMPLSHYYRAAAHLTRSGYAEWLYRTKIRVLFAGDERPETAFNLMILALHGHNLHADKNVNDWEETYPMLYHLLVDPIVGSAPWIAA